MRIGDLISVSDFPAVVSLAHVAALKETLRSETADGGEPRGATQQALAGYLAEYFTGEPENRAGGPGGAFMVRGVYGSGKSHLLAVVSLLAEFAQAWPVFLAHHQEYRDIARCFSPQRGLIVAQVSLDESVPLRQPLEDVILDAIQRELRRCGVDAALGAPEHVVALARQYLLPFHQRDLDALSKAGARSWNELAEKDARAAALVAQQVCSQNDIPLKLWRSRAEAMGLLEDALRENGRGGLVLLIDELGLFLSAKGKRELDADASFLQFIGQHAGRAPLWVVATVQRSLEEIGDADRHTLRQIRDRFEQHSLSIAQARQVLSRRLIRKKDPDGLRTVVDELHALAARDGAVPHSREALAECYPLNPPALELLEALADSALSKTRSLIQFVQESARAGLLERAHDQLITAADVFDYFWPAMREMPECAAQRNAFSFLESRARHFGEDAALALRLAKGLALCNLAGVQWSVRQHAGAAAACCEKAREALESLRRRGAYVEVNRQAGEWADIYYLDVGTDVSELLRRRLDGIVAGMETEDQRVLDFAYAACSEQGFPVGALTSAKAVGFEWLNTRRWATVEVCDLRSVDEARLRNAAAAIESAAASEDACLFVGALYAADEQLAAWDKAGRPVSGRFSAGLRAWIPRRASAREMEVLREHAALRIALQDPGMRQGKKAPQMRRLASSRAQGLQDEVVRIVRRLYAEGRVAGVGAQAPAQPPRLDREWERVLAELLAPALAALYPDFGSLAPRRPLLGRQQVNQVLNQFLRPDQPAVLPGSSLEAHVRDLLEPLGLARREGGRWSVSCEGGAAVEAALQLLGPEPAAFTDIERALAKSLGLVREQVELALAAMAKAGWVVPCDAFLRPLAFEQIGTPVAEQAPFWARAQLIPKAGRSAALALARALFDWQGEELDLPAQQRLWRAACAWAAHMREDLPALRQAVERVSAALGHERVLWAGTLALLHRAEAFAGPIPAQAPAREGLGALLQALEELESGPADLARLRAVEEFAHRHAAQIAAAGAYLAHDALAAMPGSMVEKMSQRLQQALAQGDGLIDGADQTARLAEDFLRAYSNEYCAWHAQAFAAAGFRPYLEARKSAWYSALRWLDQAGLDRGGARARVASLLEQVSGMQCAGERLPGALRESPACPQCGLRVGQRLALPDLGEMERRAKQALAEALTWLKRAEAAQAVKAGLAGRDDEAAAALRSLVAAGEGATAEQVAAMPAEAAPLLARMLAKPRAARSIEALQTRLRGRTSKGEAARSFSEWLDPQQDLKDDDVIEIT